MAPLSRRTLLAGAFMLTVSPISLLAAPALPLIAVSKDPNCGCCSGWVEHLRAAGFRASVNNVGSLPAVKTRLGVPDELASCHTAEVAGYVIEGHVPASAITRLLTERPTASGLAVPGMPVGSPGMEVPGTPNETYDVVLFGPSLRRSFGRYKGATAL
jgi:hypothetical protein